MTLVLDHLVGLITGAPGLEGVPVSGELRVPGSTPAIVLTTTSSDEERHGDRYRCSAVVEAFCVAPVALGTVETTALAEAVRAAVLAAQRTTASGWSIIYALPRGSLRVDRPDDETLVATVTIDWIGWR